MGLGIARIPMPNTQIPNLIGYNTHTHRQNTQFFFGYSDEFFLFYQTSILFLKNIFKAISGYLIEIIAF